MWPDGGTFPAVSRGRVSLEPPESQSAATRMNRRIRAALCFAALGLVGCGAAEAEVIETARQEMGCDALATKYLGSPSRNSERQFWLVEGCGQVRHYECRPTGFEYTCDLTSARELPKPELSAY